MSLITSTRRYSNQFSRLNGRKRYLIAESDLNDVRVIESHSKGGYGIDAQWNDDFHHCLHTILTKESQGYYQDFGTIKQMAKAIKEGFVYSWDYSAYRKRYHGSSSADIHSLRYVVFSQNHDQVGNRMKGERLAALVSFEALKVASGLVLLSSNIPLLFMGEEYGEDAPFLYFMSFGDKKLISAVREGRKKEFAAFNWQGKPEDPYDENTFLKSKLKWDKINEEKHRILLGFYKKLIQIRNANPAIFYPDKDAFNVDSNEKSGILCITRSNKESGIHIAVNFNKEAISYKAVNIKGEWRKILDSADTQWLGPGSKAPAIMREKSEILLEPLSLVLYERGK